MALNMFGWKGEVQLSQSQFPQVTGFVAPHTSGLCGYVCAGFPYSACELWKKVAVQSMSQFLEVRKSSQ